MRKPRHVLVVYTDRTLTTEEARIVQRRVRASIRAGGPIIAGPMFRIDSVVVDRPVRIRLAQAERRHA